MSTPGTPRQQIDDVLPGLGIAVGAGAGIAVGVAIAGGPGVALGAAVGGGLGVVAGAAVQALRSHQH